MTHSIWELMEYASSIITLFPGDVLNSGTSRGTSSGAFAEGTRSGYLQAGEVHVTPRSVTRGLTRVRGVPLTGSG